jgi:branched-chain amino acid transport system permease protein
MDTKLLILILLMGISVLIAVFLWLVLYRTKLGAAVRAGVDDRETASALGVNIDRICSLIFTLSALLVGLAGVLGGSYLQLSESAATTFLENLELLQKYRGV